MTDKRNDGASVDWTGVDLEMAREIKKQGETFLQAQLQAALAADQRATTMAGIFVTVATAIVAGGIAYWDKSGSYPVLAASFAGALCLFVAAGFGAWAARPIDFYFPGNQPSQWFAGREGSLAEMLGGEAENYDERIEANDDKLGKNQSAIYSGFVIALCSPIVAALAWVIAEAISLSSRA